MKAMQI